MSSSRQKPSILCIIIVCLTAIPLFAQQESEEAKRRRQALEDILQIQDLRSVHDSRLIKFLSDPDPIVQERATLAYASTQDSTQIGLITRNLTSATPAVQSAAAFALGQIGSQMSLKGRQELEYDLIWKRMDQTLAAPRLVEEIGKFGTETALDELVLRIGGRTPTRYDPSLAMSIARFAIRRIVSTAGVNYLLRFALPGESMPWEISYALERVGRHVLVREQLGHLLTAWKHPDPAVRMNIATLFGKYPEERDLISPLEQLARYDPDWRVRVNAEKALGNFPLLEAPSALDALRRAFFDENHHVALTAIAAVSRTGIAETDTLSVVRETYRQLRLLAENRSSGFHWQLQGEAAMAIARMSGRAALSSIPAESSLEPPPLRAQLLRAIGQTGSLEGMPALTEAASSENPLISSAALEGMRSLATLDPGDTSIATAAYDAALEALKSRDVARVATAAALLADSLFLRAESAPLLVEALADLHAEDDLEAMLEICTTLGKLRDARAVGPLRALLDQPDRALALAASGALGAITGRDYSNQITTGLLPWHVDFDFAYLRSLPDTVLVQLETVRGDVVLELYPRLAPFTVMNMLKLARERGFYRGLPFHRVVPNFVIQGGDPRGDGWGGPGWTIRSEFTPLSFSTGAMGVASAGKDTEGSQFFITHSPQPHLDGRYTLLGRVRSGQNVVDRIEADDRIMDLRVLDR